MNNPILQLLVVTAIAVFLILRLKNVLGTREGFEKPPLPQQPAPTTTARTGFEVIEGGPDRDIVDHVAEGSPAAEALAAMKGAEPSFNVAEFLQGARGAYEMILMAFEKGEIEPVMGFLSPEVYETFAQVIDARAEQGLTVESEFIGMRELALADATFDKTTGEAEVSVRYLAEITSVVRDANGTVIEGTPNEIKRQRDTWTFARVMGSNDPNWQLVATGE